MQRNRITVLLFSIFCILLCMTVCSSEDTNEEDAKKNTFLPTNAHSTIVDETPSTNVTTKNETAKSNTSFMHNLNTEMLIRTFYVLMGVTAIVVVYFVIRAWRTRKRKSKTRKYGLITSSGNDLEMEPLDQDMDEDEDMTVFEMNNRGKK